MNNSPFFLDELQNNIFLILETRFGIRKNKDKFSDNGNDSFFGNELNLTAEELVYLTHIIEQEYNIYFSEESFDDSRFYSVKGLTELVQEKSMTTELR